MAKQVIHIGVAVSTDGFMPGKANIINIAAALGDLSQFNVNVAPQNGIYGDSPFWAKHPQELATLKTNPISLNEAMSQFRSWLSQWQGRLAACTSSLDFWHLFTAMMATGKDCPFGSRPLDVASYNAALQGNKLPVTLQTEVIPLAVAKARWRLVSGGRLPVFGQKPAPKPKSKSKIPPQNRGVAEMYIDHERAPTNMAQAINIAPPTPNWVIERQQTAQEYTRLGGNF